MSFVVLADLLDGVDPEILGALPAPQRRGLAVALHREEPSAATSDSFAVAAGFRAVVRELSARAAVLIAVDDAQWVDDASAIALAYVARRLTDTRTLIIVSKRSDVPVAIERDVKDAELSRLTVGPLSFGATSRMLSDRLGPVLPRRLARTIYEASHGNPLFALELGRLLAEARARDESVELQLPELAEDAFAQRVRNLAAPVRRVLLAVSLSAGLGRPELARLAGEEAVDAALAVDVIAVDRFGVRPAHPQLAVSAQHDSTPLVRAQLHADLAEVVQDQTLRARHMAMAAEAPDSTVADEVVTAAARAIDMGAVHDGEQLATHAVRLTPPDDPQWPDRVLLLARYRLLAGYHAELTALLERHLADLPPGRYRALAHLLLAEVSDGAAADAHLESAIEQAPNDAEITAAVLTRRANWLLIARVEHIGRAVQWAEQAWSSTRETGTPSRARAATVYAWSRVLQGRRIDELTSAVPVPDGTIGLHEVVDRPRAVGHAFRGELAMADAVLAGTYRRALDRGDFTLTAACDVQRAEFALRAGRVAEVSDILANLDESDPGVALYVTRLRAVQAAVEGRPRDAVRLASDVLRRIRTLPDRVWDELEATRALGVAAIFSRDLTSAARHLQRVWEHTVEEGIDDPGAFPVAADLVQALVGTELRESAVAVTERLGRLAQEQDHPWGLATWRRCSAMIAMSAGYVDTAAESLAGAARDYAQLGLCFDEARTLLYLGSQQRRGRKRGLARTTLTDAVEAFETLGCPGWTDSARAELARISGRPPAPSHHLTASERSVVELAIGGLSNKEIANQLFVGTSTVEAHLSSAYRKLGVRSRSQLTQALDH